MVNSSNFHLAAFYGSVTNGVANMAIAGVPDSILTRNVAGNFILPEAGRPRLAWSSSVGLQRARLNTPALRYIGLPYLAPTNLGLTMASPPNLYDPGDMGPTIPQADEISVEATHATGAPENVFTCMLFMFRYRPIPPGPSYQLRFTGALAGAAGVWVNGSMVPDQTLPAGIYSVVGMDIQGTNLVGGRLIFAGGGYRPGCIGRNLLSSVADRRFTDGSLGEYGQFDSVNVPNLEVFCTGANAAQEVYLEVVRVGGR